MQLFYGHIRGDFELGMLSVVTIYHCNNEQTNQDLTCNRYILHFVHLMYHSRY